MQFFFWLQATREAEPAYLLGKQHEKYVFFAKKRERKKRGYCKIAWVRSMHKYMAFFTQV